MDEADRASGEQDASIAEALRKRRAAGPVPNGRCHYCDEIVNDNARWCSVECRNDWEKTCSR